jgi:hypothetical protein
LSDLERHDEQARVELLVQHAEDRLQRQLAEGDAIDAKALGTLALSAAAIALLVATHDTINRLWWIPVIGLAVASGFLLWAIRPRRFDVGPDLEWLYNAWEAAKVSAADASRDMLAELLASVENNQGPTRSKEVCLKLGLLVLIVSLLGSIPIALIRPSQNDSGSGAIIDLWQSPIAPQSLSRYLSLQRLTSMRSGVLGQPDRRKW